MPKTISVSDLRIGNTLNNEAFALREFEQKVSRQGKTYYNVALSDKTGEVRGKVWSENMVNVAQGVVVGEIVAVTGEIQEYAGKPQIIIEKIAKVENMAPEEFLPVTSRDRSQMTNDLEEEIHKTINPYLKNLLEKFWNDSEFKDKFINYPAGMYVHHGYVGGLLEHVWEMWQLSQPYLKIYHKIDRDLYFTSLFLHYV